MAKIKVELDGRDCIELNLNNGQVSDVKLTGCIRFLKLIHSLKDQHGQDPGKWPLPEGTAHESVLVRELILKSRGDWSYPYEEEEICHCRNVPTRRVDQAVIAGAHTTDKVSRLTGASTACGTCRADVLRIISYRT